MSVASNSGISIDCQDDALIDTGITFYKFSVSTVAETCDNLMTCNNESRKKS